MSTSDTIVVDLLHTQDSDTDQDDESNHGETTRKCQYHWNPCRIIALLRIIIVRSPFSAPYKSKRAAWETIAQDYNLSVNKPNAVSGRKAKATFYILLSVFRKQEAESLRKGGTD